MNLSPVETLELKENITHIDYHLRSIAGLLHFKAALPVAEINKVLQPLYDSLLKTGIIREDGTMNEKEIFQDYAGSQYKRLLTTDISESFYSLDYSSELECGIVTWNGLISNHEFQMANENFLQLAKQYKIKKMIRDTRNFTILSPLSKKWFTEYIIPQFHMNGIRFSAVIAPQNQLSKRIVEDIIHEVNPEEIDVRLFSTMDEAKIWIAGV